MVSKLKLEMLKLTGQVAKILLLPQDMGGSDIPQNVLWLYKSAAAQKADFDNELRRLVSQGNSASWQYACTPTYQGDSVVECMLSLRAMSSDGDCLEMVIDGRTCDARAGKPLFTAADHSRSAPFEKLALEHAVSSFDKQLQLAEFLGEGWRWEFDTNSGALTLIKQSGERTTVPAQILGTESDGDRSWLWSWANKESGLPPQVVSTAEKLRLLGLTEGIVEFSEPQRRATQVSPELMAMVASGICKSAAYFIGPYPGGAVYLLIEQLPGLPAIPHAGARILTIFPQIAHEPFLTDVRLAFSAYARHYGYATNDEAGRVTATHPQFGRILADFDKHGRLAKLDGLLPAAKS